LERNWDELTKWIIRRRSGGMLVATICAQARISRKVFYYWWNRYQAEGWEGLEEEQRGRPEGPELDEALKGKVVKLRKRYGWGPNKKAGCLNRKDFCTDHDQVNLIICEAGLAHPISEQGKNWGTERFRREHCNSLWQADFRLCSDDNWMISYQDDHSRLMTGSVRIWSPTGENAIFLLEKAVTVWCSRTDAY